jgi:hypothetical protein
MSRIRERRARRRSLERRLRAEAGAVRLEPPERLRLRTSAALRLASPAEPERHTARAFALAATILLGVGVLGLLVGRTRPQPVVAPQRLLSLRMPQLEGLGADGEALLVCEAKLIAQDVRRVGGRLLEELPVPRLLGARERNW